MAKRDPLVTLRQMLDSAREAAALVRGRSRASLDPDRVLTLALIRLLEVLGEAASRMPLEQRSQYRGIPWAQLVGLRNRLIHAYDQVDLDILWQILREDLPALVAELERIVPSA